MPQYIDKLRVPVRLARSGAPPVVGLLSLAPRAELHDGPETLLERLNSPQRVLPFQQPDGELVLLVTRLQIEWVEAGPEVDARLVRPATWMATREELVSVRTARGEVFDGVISMEMPHEFNRASDYLNGPEDFFALQTETATRLVNKQCVVDVLVRASVTLPRAA